ncbi:hypothetical protein PoB_000498400 [Plakobranchus ocellatus]|uniref:Uncharacterized protein n=1 Tax=Plakobranchus ocellatus TaxID=259542 RepID=A0AAV3Y6C9_9GAST|nr:hypothetical protein PoB_000498400 [Plakobranchus ocellatus]
MVGAHGSTQNQLPYPSCTCLLPSNANLVRWEMKDDLTYQLCQGKQIKKYILISCNALSKDRYTWLKQYVKQKICRTNRRQGYSIHIGMCNQILVSMSRHHGYPEEKLSVFVMTRNCLPISPKGATMPKSSNTQE